MEELEKILSPFILERKRKFDNKSVIGGFSNFIISNLSILEKYKVDINKIKSVIKDYENGGEENRKKIHKEILDEITNSVIRNREIEIEKIAGVGEKRKENLERLRIRTSYDLIYFFPRKYIDFGKLIKISNIKKGEYVQIQGEVLTIEKKLIRKGLNILKVKFFDGTGVIFGIWFNQLYLEKFFRKGKKFLLMGIINYNFGEWQIENPNFEEIYDFKKESGEKIISIYPQTSGLSSKMISNYIRESIKLTKNFLIDPLPYEIIKKRELPSLTFAIENIHFPLSNKNLILSQKRLKYEELFLFQLFLFLRRMKIKEKMGYKYEILEDYKEKFLNSIPFKLTDAQLKVIKEIEDDLKSGKVMNRLLHGEVGSGKTIVCAYALYLSALNYTQGAMMSPTEILAMQTYNVLKKFLTPFNINVELITGSTKNKDEIKSKLSKGEIDIIIGTHALIEEDIEFKNLTLAIVDEQHRFGVIQRASLVKKGEFPHTLVLSATPIPRTLALTLYGDLDISMIDELPPGRKSVKTIIFTNEEKERAYDFIRKKLNQKEKIYVVCPFIEENEKMEVASIKKKYEEFKERFKNIKIEFLHGRMKALDKERIIKEFREGETQILISTSVVEVGIDIPEATVILIEDANRFGLLTLHQLRGRVGRGEKESFCILVLSNYDKEALRRLRVLERTNSGFEVSEWDLKLRGTGELGGEKQHGFSDFKIVNLLKEEDIKMLDMVKEDVENFIKSNSILNYPFLLKELSLRFNDFKYLDISWE